MLTNATLMYCCQHRVSGLLHFLTLGTFRDFMLTGFKMKEKGRRSFNMLL